MSSELSRLLLRRRFIRATGKEAFPGAGAPRFKGAAGFGLASAESQGAWVVAADSKGGWGTLGVVECSSCKSRAMVKAEAMRLGLVALFIVAAGCMAVAQSECRDASGSVVERHQNFTSYSVSLPSRSGEFKVQAFLPNNRDHVVRGVVFSLSRVVSSVTDASVDFYPVAEDVAAHGQAAIVIGRRLSWPFIDESVGTYQPAVLCAEQWLSSHIRVRPDSWYFVGPTSDRPTFEQLKAVGDTHSMTFMWGLPIADASDGKFTEDVLRGGSPFLIQNMRSFLDSTTQK